MTLIVFMAYMVVHKKTGNIVVCAILIAFTIAFKLMYGAILCNSSVCADRN